MLLSQFIHHFTPLADSARIYIRVALLGASDQFGLHRWVVLKVKLTADQLLDIRADIAPAALTHAGIEFV